MSDKIKCLARLWAIWNEFDKSWNYSANSVDADMSAVGWVLVEERTVEFDRPPADADWSKEAVELTRKEQQRIRAEAEAKCTLLNERINSMLALEYKGAK